MTRPSRVLLLCCALLVGCSVVAPQWVEQVRFDRGEPVDRLAVLPFTPTSRLSKDSAGLDLTAAGAAELVTRFVSEAVEQRVPVIPQSDVQLAFEAEGPGTPRRVPELAAMVAARELGADAVLLGEVDRYREREGSAVGSMRPASVSFRVTLYAAPAGTRLWTASFDHTQAALTDDLFESARLPGHGSRFLTVAELARFGAEQVAREMPLGR